MVTIDNASFSPDTVAVLCVEYWKLVQTTRKATSLVGDPDGRRLEGQVKYSERQLSSLLHQLGLKLIEFEGEIFHAGISASADNAEDFSDNDELVIVKTLEPAIVAGMKVLKLGRVLVEQTHSSKEQL
ncbi:hypothetical protein [Pseudovibrio sp. POLY-S9]|uniref:hypothetical protein n=1 Tax=Pseudovibrio sp. POLY-S9 TaxID=1576596 RepID=UPI000AE0BF14|nr:hypothetical protein [Pseudovibrio sp. POLY-S9]